MKLAKNKIFYWSPSLVNIATNKAVINSAHGINIFSKKYAAYIVNFFGEFSDPKFEADKKKIKLINHFNKKLIKLLPKYGKIKSRISFMIIFIFSFLPLKNLIKKQEPEYLIIHLITSLPLVLLIIFNFKTKFILRISGFPKMNFLRKLLWKIASKKIYKVTCPSAGTYNYLKNLNIITNDKIHILYDPVINVKEVIKKRKEKKVEYENYFLAVGRLTKQKDFSFLCKALKDKILVNKDIKLLIAGEGEEKNKLIKYVNNNNLQKNIIFLDHIDNIFPYFYNAKAFILSSMWEDPGFVLIEAGFNRTLVLSNDSEPGPKEIIENNFNGVVYKKKEIESFHDKFDQILKDTNNKNLIYNNLKNVKKFTIFNHFKSLEKILSI